MKIRSIPPLALTVIALALPVSLLAQETAAPAAPAAPATPATPTTNDTNADGKVSAAERNAAREQGRKKMLERFDTDKDGTLNPEEKQAAEAGRKAKMLERFDADKDGTLSASEKQAARDAARKNLQGPVRKKLAGSGTPKPPGTGKKGPAAARPLPQKMQAFDTDGDGRLNPTERQAAQAARQARGESRPRPTPNQQGN